jgi:hypothetical protein
LNGRTDQESTDPEARRDHENEGTGGDHRSVPYPARRFEVRELQLFDVLTF